MTCPSCHSTNHANAPFCTECGVALSVGNAAGEFVSANTTSAEVVPVRVAAHLSVRQGRWWLLLGFAGLLVAVVGGWMWQRDQAAVQSYRQGLTALKAQQWHRAAELLAPLAQRNSTAASQYQTARTKVEAWDSAYRQAAEAERAGATTAAAAFYRQAEAIEPGYRDAAAKLTLMRQRNPLLVYRTEAGLYLATADGQTLKQLPANGYGFNVLATSPDGKLVCYTYNSDYGKAQTRNLVVGDIARGFYSEQRFYFRANFQPRPLDAAFINNGAGLLFVVGGKLGELNSGDDQMKLYYFDLVGVGGMVSIGDTYLVARPNITDKYVYYVPSDNPRQLYTYALDEQFGTTIEPTDGDVIALARSDKVNREPGLLYATAVDNRLHLYLRLFIRPEPTLLLDEQLPATATVKLATSAQGGAAVALLGTDRAWLLLGDVGAKRLLDGWQLSFYNLTGVAFSPDGRFLLLVNQADEARNAVYLVLDQQGEVLRFNDGVLGSAGWLRDRFYVYQQQWRDSASPPCGMVGQPCGDKIYFFTPSSGFNTVLTLMMQPNGAAVPLADGKSLLYPTADGVYLVTVPYSAASKLFDGANGVWVVGQ